MKVLYAVALVILGWVPLLFIKGDVYLGSAIAATPSNSTRQSVHNTSTHTQLPEALSPEALSVEVLETFFQSWQVGEANFYQNTLMNAYNDPNAFEDWQTEHFFRLALQLTDNLLVEPTYSSMIANEKLSRFTTTDLGVWGIDSICVAECTEPGFALNLEEFQAIALKTTTTADDDFFSLLQSYYGYAYALDGEVWGWPTFFQLTWDYGGYSLLGEGKHLQLLLQLEQYQQQHGGYLLRSPLTVFAQYVQDMRHNLLQDILVRADCSGPEQAAIEAELSWILAQVQLNSAEQTALQQRLEAFQLPLSPDIQVNCQTFGQCTCEGG